MNRLGMMVDLAHVSVDTMKVVLNISKAPVIFSHSSAYSICPHRRNVPDDVLRQVVSVGHSRGRAGTEGGPGGAGGSGLFPPQASTGSLVMVNFYNAYVTCSDKATVSDVAGEEVPRWVGGGSDPPPALLTPDPSTDHMDYVKKVAGAKAVGFGGDYDGVNG